MIDMFWKAAVLGIVQGITEFLPISSTGHLILVDQFLHMAEGPFSKMFNVVIQFGSILAVVIYFHKKLIPVAMFSDKKVCRDTLEIWFKTLAGVFPILLIGFLLASKIEMLQDSPLVVAAALLIGGVVLIKVEAWCRKERPIETFHELSYTRAVLIGLIQCLAMIPGTSRSASTIIGGLALGASRTLAAEYSFFLAIPTMTAASGYSLLKHGGSMTTAQWGALAIGFLVSFFVAWAVIAWLMNYIRTRDFRGFGWYRIIFGIVILAATTMGWVEWRAV